MDIWVYIGDDVLKFIKASSDSGHIIRQSSKYLYQFCNHSIIKSHRQPKNLKEILTKAKFEDQSNNVSAKISKCSSPKCGIGNNIIVGNKFQFKNGPLFEVKTNIKCEGCGEDYIIETGNELRKRMTVHRQQNRQ